VIRAATVRERLKRKIKVRSSKIEELEQLQPRDIAAILRVVPALTRLPVRDMFSSYDVDADVLYLAFERPQRATDSEMRDDGIIMHRRGQRVVGVTILDASAR
jgi:uncharacterized protein YuzE